MCYFCVENVFKRLTYYEVSARDIICRQNRACSDKTSAGISDKSLEITIPLHLVTMIHNGSILQKNMLPICAKRAIKCGILKTIVIKYMGIKTFV
jgi:hypothetical protein